MTYFCTKNVTRCTATGGDSSFLYDILLHGCPPPCYKMEYSSHWCQMPLMANLEKLLYKLGITEENAVDETDYGNLSQEFKWEGK